MISAQSGCSSLCSACHYKNFEYSEQLTRKQTWASKNLSAWNLKIIKEAPVKERIYYRKKSWLWAFKKDNALSFGMRKSVKQDRKWIYDYIVWDRCPIHDLEILQIIQEIQCQIRPLDFDELLNDWVGIWFGSPHIVIISKQKNSKFTEGLNWSKIVTPQFNQVSTHYNSQVGKKIFSHAQIKNIYGDLKNKTHPVKAFRQVAQGLLKEARDEAVTHLIAQKPEIVLDLYCGTGALSCLLPESISWVGIEMSKEAVKFANELKPKTRFIHEAFVGTVEHRILTDAVFKKLDQIKNLAIYLNPPRSGLSSDGLEKFITFLKNYSPRAISYLSCSASSLARDLKEITKSGYNVKLIQPYDFFPHTEHFELLALLEYKNENQ